MARSKKQELILKLEEGLEHLQNYQQVLTDDEGLFVVPDDCLYELAYSNGRLCVGDLRDILAVLKGEM